MGFVLCCCYMGKKRFLKVRDPITGWWHSPKDFDKPVATFPLAKIMTSDGDKGMHSVGVIYDPSEFDLTFRSSDGREIPGLFHNVRLRFKEAIAHYVAQGWLTNEDLAELGLEKIETKLGSFKFPTTVREHTVKRKVERTREDFRL
ncbi:hypothetical protein ES703_48914 [subsurface metagenome]